MLRPVTSFHQFVTEEEKPVKTWKESLGDGQFEGDRWYHVLFKFFFPLGVYFLFASIVLLIYGMDDLMRWMELTILFLVPPMGTATIVPLGMADGFSGLTMVFTVTMVDAVCSMYVCWWFVLVKKVPLLGRLFIWMEEKAGKKVHDDPKLKKATWWVIYSALLIPIQGSGGINMSLIGRMVGLRAGLIISAVVAGSFTVALVVAFMTSVGMKLLQQSLTAFIVFIMMLIQLGLFLYYLKHLRDMKKWEAELAERA